MFEQLRNRFYQIGWLVPTILPLTMIGGRGLFHTVFYLYILWALLSARRLRLDNLKPFLTLYLCMLGAYALSIPFAIDPALALKLWGTLILYTTSALITLSIIQNDRGKLQRLLSAFGVAGLIALALSYAGLIRIMLTQETFVPRLQMESVHLVIYLPFMLAWFWSRLRPGVNRTAGILFVLALVAGYIVLSEERASFISLICAVACFFMLVARVNARRAILLTCGAALVALTLNGQGLLRGLASGDDLFSRLDSLSSYRLSLWTQALEHPPEHPLVGVGMGNVRHYDAVMQLPGDNKVKHLHNIWMDAWYDTGLAGLSLLVAIIAYVLSGTVTAWRKMSTDTRRQAAILLTAGLTLLTQAQFIISYASREIGIYFFICLALLAYLSHAARRPAAHV